MFVPIGHTLYSWSHNTIKIIHEEIIEYNIPYSHTQFSWNPIETIQNNSRKALGFNKLGIVAKKKKNLATACELFLSAIRIDEMCIFAYLNLGVILADMGKRDLAYQYFLHAYHLAPSYEPGVSSFVSFLLRSHDHVSFALMLAESFKPDSPTTISNLVNALRRCGLEQQAVDTTWRLCGIKHPKYIKIKSYRNQTKSQSLVVVCIKWGTKYDSNYVNKLYRGVARNLSVPFEFRCYTDDPTGINLNEIKILPIVHKEWTGWWTKPAVLFDGTLFRDSRDMLILYIDLDTIITGSLDQIANYNGVFALLGTDDFTLTEDRLHGYNSSVVVFRNRLERLCDIFTRMQDLGKENIETIVQRFDFWLEMNIEDADRLQEEYPKIFVDYKTHIAGHGGTLPIDAAVVNFPQHPKPHQCMDELWVRQHWC